MSIYYTLSQFVWVFYFNYMINKSVIIMLNVCVSWVLCNLIFLLFVCTNWKTDNTKTIAHLLQWRIKTQQQRLVHFNSLFYGKLQSLKCPRSLQYSCKQMYM